jgi:uncharacterized protein YceK
MRKELALLGLAIIAFSLVGCTSVNEEISSTQGYTETTVSSGGTAPSSGVGAEPVPAAAIEMGITGEDLSISDLDIDLNDDGFSTELLI